jgi:hypothetical protein
MARAGTETATTRAPRGTKPVMQAFFAALDNVPETSRPVVAKAAQTMIRDELKNRREKLKAVAAKVKARHPQPAKRAAKPAAPKIVEQVPETPVKRRTRKQDIPVAA